MRVLIEIHVFSSHKVFLFQMTGLKDAINDMATRSLRCVAIAFRKFEADKIPTDDEQLSRWVLPEDDLVLLAIVGIKVSITYS